MFCIHTPLRSRRDCIEKAKAPRKKLILTSGTLARTEELVRSAIWQHFILNGKFQLVQNYRESWPNYFDGWRRVTHSAALTLADIGVVMNESADISKQMSDILLLDNRLRFLRGVNSLSESLQKLIQKGNDENSCNKWKFSGFGLLNWLESPSNLSILHNLTTLRIVLLVFLLK